MTGPVGIFRRSSRFSPMGVLSHLFSLCVGAYGGAFFAQNYEIAKLPSVSELAKKLEVYLQEYKKDR
ncbi:hypothetical protein Q1695_008555 [Nippostrongylus brasiliensis]|nr:hypothetical protein Q1695_008555 [Nippostrongylus brasiliensis]